MIVLGITIFNLINKIYKDLCAAKAAHTALKLILLAANKSLFPD